MSRLTRGVGRSRALLAAHPIVWFALGMLFAGQLPGEPFHDRVFLAGLLGLAVIAGIVYEGTRRGGTLDLLDELVAGDE